MSKTRPELFGTDGIRAAFGTPPLDETTVRRLAAALAADLGAEHAAPRVVLGGDTRDSTPTLCRWLGEELAARGAALSWLGTVPTPCVAAVVRALGAACGVAVSASHNPYPDNGIKLIDGAGFKWSPAAELRLEERLAALPASAAAAALDRELTVDRGAVTAYLDGLAGTLPGERPLAGLRLAVDAGNGAASPYAFDLFTRLGAEVAVHHAAPDGRNVNDGCGSTHPEVIAELTRATRSDLGFSFDGDADRVIVADELGEVRDGDAVLYLWARDLQARAQLPGERIVATSMSNLGLEVALQRCGIAVVRCDVGDREVVGTMRREGIVLGGEQSGHVVNLALSTQGDGLLTALQVAGLRARAKEPLSRLLADFARFPQLIRNVRVSRKPALDAQPRIAAARAATVARLGQSGRLVLRYSGTEPLARIMIEGPDRGEIEALSEELAAVIAQELR